jgi:hypothetical protein
MICLSRLARRGQGWQGVAMDSLTFYSGMTYPSIAVSEVARWQSGYDRNFPCQTLQIRKVSLVFMGS